MKVLEHIYTSLKVEFETQYLTEGLSREEVLTLENQSNYFLPPELLYAEGVEYPVKYVLYPLSSRYYCIGRGIYKGLDSLGRVGNYLFHNVLFDTKELVAHGADPLAVLHKLIKDNYFVSDSQESRPEEVSLEIENRPQLFDSLTAEKKQNVAKLLLLFTEESIPRVLVVGSEPKRIEFAELILSELPPSIKYMTGIETYGYGQGTSAVISCIPEEKEYQGTYGEKIQVQWGSSESISFRPTVPAVDSAMLQHFTTLDHTDRIQFIDFLFSLKQGSASIVHFGELSKTSQEFFALRFSASLLHMAIRANDLSKVELFAGNLGESDWKQLAKNPIVLDLLYAGNYGFLPRLTQAIFSEKTFSNISGNANFERMVLSILQQQHASENQGAALAVQSNLGAWISAVKPREEIVLQLCAAYAPVWSQETSLAAFADSLSYLQSPAIAFYRELARSFGSKQFPSVLFSLPLPDNQNALHTLLRKICSQKQSDIMKQMKKHTAWFEQLSARSEGSNKACLNILPLAVSEGSKKGFFSFLK